MSSQNFTLRLFNDPGGDQNKQKSVTQKKLVKNCLFYHLFNKTKTILLIDWGTVLYTDFDKKANY